MRKNNWLKTLSMITPIAGFAVLGSLGTSCKDYDRAYDEVEVEENEVGRVGEVERTEYEQNHDELEAALRSGSQVTLSGEVEETYASGAFQLDYERGISNEEILVVPRGTQTKAPKEDAEVIVTGKVRRMTVADVEREFGFESSIFDDRDDREQMVVAEAITVTERDEEIF